MILQTETATIGLKLVTWLFKMVDFHIVLFLLAALSTVVPVKAADRCPHDGDWQYHNRTGTCIYVNRTKVAFYQAKRTCKTFFGGSNNSIPGHLVFIFDKDTDDYVKELLRIYNIVQALIGLSALSDPGLYTWEDPSKELGNYFGWAPGQPLNEMRKAAVVITENGWKEFQVHSIAEFVCQVDVGAQLPGYSHNATNCHSNGRYTCLADPNVQEMDFKHKERRDQTSPTSASDKNLTIIVVPAVLGLVLVITVIALVFFVVRRRRFRAVPNMGTRETQITHVRLSNINDEQNTYESVDCGRRPAAVTKQNCNVYEQTKEGAVSLNVLQSEGSNTSKATEQDSVYTNMTLTDEIEERERSVSDDDPTANYDRLAVTETDPYEDGTYADIAADNVAVHSSKSETVDESDRTLYYTVN